MLVYSFSWIEKKKQNKKGGGGGESYKDMTNECSVRIFARYQLPLCDIFKPMLSFIHRLSSYKYTAKPLLKPFDWYWAIGKDMKCDILRLDNATTSLLVVKAGINLLNDYYIVIIGNMVYKVMIIQIEENWRQPFLTPRPSGRRWVPILRQPPINLTTSILTQEPICTAEVISSIEWLWWSRPLAWVPSGLDVMISTNIGLGTPRLRSPKKKCRWSSTGADLLNH